MYSMNARQCMPLGIMVDLSLREYHMPINGNHAQARHTQHGMM